MFVTTQYAPPSSPPQLVYSDEGSTFRIKGKYSSRICEVTHPDICPYNVVEQLFSGNGAVSDRGDLRIVVKDGQPVLEANLPVTVSSTRTRSMSGPKTMIEPKPMSLNCRVGQQ